MTTGKMHARIPVIHRTLQDQCRVRMFLEPMCFMASVPMQSNPIWHLNRTPEWPNSMSGHLNQTPVGTTGRRLVGPKPP